MAKGRGILAAAYFAIFCFIGLEVYANKWEERQQSTTFVNPTILSVDEHVYGPHLNIRTFRVGVEGDSRSIDFPAENWDENIREGKLEGRMEVRPSFRYFGILDELDGLSVSRK